jgi:hypothetical protein
VSLFVEAGAFVNRAAFNEDALHRIDRLIAPVAADSVDHLNHGAIETAQQTVARILGQFEAASRSEFRESTVSGPNLFYTGRGREIEAQTKRYHRTDDERLLDVGRVTFLGVAVEV